VGDDGRGHWFRMSLIHKEGDQLWPKVRSISGQVVGYDPDSTAEYLLSDNPNFSDYNEDYGHRISYDFNYAGHRTPKTFDKTNHFLVVGGSQTFGTGVPEDKCYPSLIAKRLGMDYYNMSLPGVSHDINISNLLWYLSTHSPKFILWEWLFDSRNYLILPHMDDMVLPLISTHVEKYEKVFDIRGLPEFFLSCNDVGYNKSRRQVHEMALQNISNMHKVHQFDFNKDFEINSTDVGRDGLHYGIDTHKSIAELLTVGLNLD